MKKKKTTADLAREETTERPTRRADRTRNLPAGAAGARPLVAIVGRPNVGKSTLFNRIAGQRLAIVEDTPGITRDRHYADAFAFGREFVLIDTGGFDPDSDDPLKEGIVRQVKLALEEADVIVCVLDATALPLEADRKASALLRKTKKPVLYAANKADSSGGAQEALSHYSLGVDHIFPISALHGHGIGDLEEAVVGALPKDTGREDTPWGDAPRIAICGRPNAGKSSLVNRLLGEERQNVDARAGTTMDSIDALLERKGERFVLIDTAGIRRRRSVKETAEAVSVIQAIRAMERSHVVVLMVDGSDGGAEQDAKIAGLADERGRGLILVVNKIDLMTPDQQKKAEARLREILAFVPWAPVVRLSALTGRGVDRLLQTMRKVVDAHRKRVGTSEINRFFEEVLEKHPPPTGRGKPVRLYFVTQAQVAPPSFVAMTNEPDLVHFSYRRYVANQIRERFGFEGTPVRVFYRKRKRRAEPPT